MIKLYGNPLSRAGRCAWMLRELGQNYETIEVDFFRGEHKQPAYLAINPMGQLPALDHAGFRLSESLAINLYLARRFGGPLAPRDLQEEMQATAWSLCAASAMEPHVHHLVAHKMALPTARRRADLAEEHWQRLSPALRAIDATATRAGFLLGDRFTVADLNVACVLAPLVAADCSFSATPHADRWLRQSLAREAAAGQVRRVEFPPPIVDRYLQENRLA